MTKCHLCGNEFKQPVLQQGGTPGKIYCSKKCRSRMGELRKKERIKKSWADGTRRDVWLTEHYGITEKEWNDIFDKQGRACAICKTTKPKSKVGWHTDHNHKTNKVRGILCENCNRGLGMYAEDISFLRHAMVYLGVHQGILNAESIEKAGIIYPFFPRSNQNGMTFGVSMAGYDIRIDQELVLMPKDFSLASSIEYFDMPNDLVGMVCDKSTHARKGLQAFNTIIEPGWRGYLTLELVNHSHRPIWLKHGDPIVQVVFQTLTQPTDRPYNGKYQDQKRGPQEAILEPVTKRWV